MSAHADGSILIWSVDREDSTAQTTIVRIPKVGKENDIVVERTQVDKKPGTLFNPLCHWAISNKPIRSFSIFDDKLAAVGDDGTLRIIDMNTEKVLDCFSSYFGGKLDIQYISSCADNTF